MPFSPDAKAAGDLIRADDWNALQDEVVRLDADKVNLGGGDTITGNLNLNGSLSLRSSSRSNSRLGARALSIEDTGNCYVAIRGNGGNQELVLGADSASTSVSTITGQDMNLRAGADLILRAGGGTERARLDAAGNLGLGVPTPASLLHLGGTSEPVLTIQSTDDNSISARLSLRQQNNRGADIYYDGVNGGPEALVFATRNSASAAFDQTERMVIETTSGHVGIGRRNPSSLLHVNNATCNGTTWSNACSRELKTDIARLSSEHAHGVLADLDPVTFRYTDGDGHPRAGFIAEDVPELVAAADRKTLSPMDILAVVTRVVQAQQEEIEALKAALAATGVAAPSTA